MLSVTNDKYPSDTYVGRLDIETAVARNVSQVSGNNYWGKVEWR